MMKLFKRKKQPGRKVQLMNGQNDYSFRRSRTLSGSPAQQASTPSGESSHRLRSDRTHLHDLRKKRRRMIGVLGLAVVSSMSLLWLMGQYTATVATVQVSPATVTPPPSGRYQQAIAQYLKERPLQRFNFWLNEASLSTYLAGRYLEVSTVTKTDSALFSAANFSVSLRRPEVAWKLGDADYFVDASGVSFRDNYFAPPSVRVRDNSGLQPSSGDLLVSGRFLGFIGQVVALTNASPVGQVSEIVVPGISSRQIEMRLASRGYPIKLYVEREATFQVEDLVRAVAYFDKRAVSPEYIDVRVEGKAYYR